MAITENFIRDPNVAGSFYEKNPLILQKNITAFFRRKKPPKEIGNKRVRAVISPHAGHLYCGTVMASVYQLLQNKEYGRVILIGPSHSVAFGSVAFDTAHTWKTPLGIIPIDTKTNELLLFQEQFDVLPKVFDREHSLEVQLPFLQTVIPFFSLLPLCTGQDLPHARIAQTISSFLSDEAVIIVSSDFSHYHKETEATAIDHTSIQAILSRNPERIDKTVDACGLEGIKILNDISVMNHWRPFLTDYQTSGDVTGDVEGVVGYAGFAYV